MSTTDNFKPSYFERLKGKTVMLYLSSNSFNEGYLEMPYDYVILNSYTFSERENQPLSAMKIINGKVILMPYDNNRALRILKGAGVKIKCFVGINDGCSEGGNHECVNNSSFFGRLSPILDDEIYYITDHFDNARDLEGLTGKLGFLNTHYEVTEFFDEELITFDENVFYGDPQYRKEHIWFIPLRRKDDMTRGYRLGNIYISASHASIWEHEDEFDCIIHGNMSQKAAVNYVPEPQKRCYMPLHMVDKDPSWLLRKAEKNRWKRIGLIPYLQGHYQEFLAICKEWKGKYPEAIQFFHLEERDMTEVRKYIPDNLFE